MHDPSSARPRVRFIAVPKSGGSRILSRLDPRLAAEYTSAVAGVASAIEAALDDRVLANRVLAASQVPPRLELEAWRPRHAQLRRTLLRLTEGGGVFRADVEECYPSIGPAAVADALARAATGVSAIRCVRVLDVLAREGVRGLPVGPAASAVLANAVLGLGDAALRSTGVRFVRWVDDWWIAASSPSHGADALVALSRALAGARLRLNATKTGPCAPADLLKGASVAGYHRAAHADPVSRLADPDAVVPGHGVVAAGRRTSRPARGRR